ncbi:MAG TPA: hypothetical protein VFB04_05365 [Terriglobales bacterium]|nr:hypothetical protein [Terriglobales bacterium]
MKCSQMNQEQRHKLISQIKLVSPRKPRQCEHIKVNGEFCGSPALRGRNYCYYHLTYIGRRMRAQRAQANATDASTVALELPPLEDAASIQMSLMQVIDAILHNRLDTKRAGLVLYALQTASANLARADFRQTQGATVASGYDDFEEDFELGDATPELQVGEEAAQAEESRSEHTEKIRQIEEMAAAYAKLDEAKMDFEEKHPPGEEELEEAEAEHRFECHFMDQFLCGIIGPRAPVPVSAPGLLRTVEREASSQRLELTGSFFGEEEELEEVA